VKEDVIPPTAEEKELFAVHLHQLHHKMCIKMRKGAEEGIMYKF